MTVHIPKPARAKFSVERIQGAYLVLTPERAIAAGPFTDRSRAQMDCERRQRDEDVKHKRGVRACMCCRQSFESEGPHNRLCGTCRGLGHDTSPYHFINPRRRSG